MLSWQRDRVKTMDDAQIRPLPSNTLVDILPSGEREAIASDDAACPACSFDDLRNFALQRFNLNGHGISHMERVAILMSGPEAAVAIVATLCHAACAPLNPALTAAGTRMIECVMQLCVRIIISCPSLARLAPLQSWRVKFKACARGYC